ncbi:unnamed protein product [Phaedon cochleariae]|uniref:Homeobox domain-containing protein n=1 Tax=Phaedon cochleariae TaxID=80249 RepID=A0A9N9SCD5_PHACE|nr:unnamed protein product [Phaedon cochleariae]
MCSRASLVVNESLEKDVLRRTYGEDRRPPKRLFTPEIKRFLKDWLVRRRENPYPNRDEKKILAVQTGLTYIQVCNWFANWRRKLKNAGKQPYQKTWGDLIKTYNKQVQGNVEHFSICSEDSIWEETETNYNYYEEEVYERASATLKFQERTGEYHHEPFQNNNNNNFGSNETQNQCYFVSSTTESEVDNNPFAQCSNKYKNHIMDKYLRDCRKSGCGGLDNLEESKPSMISKWLESAANFKPSESSYLDWTFQKSSKKKMKKSPSGETSDGLLVVHGREELDAAEALTTLANAKYKV